MNAQDYIDDLFKKHLTKSFEDKQRNPLKTAIVGVLDEYYALQDKDEAEYLRIHEELEAVFCNGLNDYFSAFQLMLEIVSFHIGSGNLARMFPDVACQKWCSWYASLVVNGYARAIADKFESLANGYSNGNEFLGHSLVGENGLNLSYLEPRYQKEFGQ